jgi:hypothetical protein
MLMGLLYISTAQGGSDASATANNSSWVQLAGDLRAEIDALEALIALQQKRLANLRRLLQYERSSYAGRLPVSVAASDRSSVDSENSCLGEVCVAPTTIQPGELEQPSLGWLQAPHLLALNGQQNDTTGYPRLLRWPAPVLPSRRTPHWQPADAHKLLKVADSGAVTLSDQPIADMRELLQRHGGGMSAVVASDACSDNAASRAESNGHTTSSSAEREASSASVLIALATNSSRVLVVRIDRARGETHGKVQLVCAADVPGRLAFVGGHATAAAAAGARIPTTLRCLLNPGTRKHPQPVPGLLVGTSDGLLLSYSALDCSLLRLVFPPVAPAQQQQQQQQSQQEQSPAAQQWSAGPVTAIAASESRVVFAVGSHVHFFSPQRSELSRTVCRLEGMGVAAPPPPPHAGQQHAAGGDAGGAGGAAVVSDLSPDPSTPSWVWVGLTDGGFLLVSAGLGIGPGGGSCVLRHTFSHLRAPSASTLQAPHRTIAGSDGACNVDAHAVSVAVHPGFVVAANSRGLLALNSTALAADRPAAAATLLHAAWLTTPSLREEGAASCLAAGGHAAASVRVAAQVLLHLLPTTLPASPPSSMAGQQRAAFATPLPTVALTVFRAELGASETYALLPPLRGSAVNPFGAGADSAGDNGYGSSGGGLGWLRFLLIGGALVGVFAWRRWGLQPGKRRRGQRRGELPTDILDDEEREAEGRADDDDDGTDEHEEGQGSGFLSIGPPGRSMSQTLLRGMAGIASLGGKALAGRGPLGGLLHMLGVELHAQRRGRQRDDAALRRGLGLGPIDAPEGDEGAAGLSGRESWARQSPFSDAPLSSAGHTGLRNRRQGSLAQLPGAPSMSFGGGALPPHLQRMLTQRLAAEDAAAGSSGGARRGVGKGRSGDRGAAGDDEDDEDDDDPLGGFSREQFDTMDAAFERLAARARRKRDRSLREAAAAGAAGGRGRGAGAGARVMMPASPCVSDGSSGSSDDGVDDDGGGGGQGDRGSSRGSDGGTPSELAAAEEAMLESQMAREGGGSGMGGRFAPMPLTSQHPHFTSPTSQRSQQRSGPAQWASLASSLASAPIPSGLGADADGEEGDDAALAAAMASSVFQQHAGGAGFSDGGSSAAQRQRRIASALTARPDSPSAYLRQGYLPPDADGEVPEPGRTHGGATGERRRPAPRSASSAAAALAHRMAERADAGVLDPDAIADGGGGDEYTSDDDA